MKKVLALIVLTLFCNICFAAVPSFDENIFAINLRTEKLINGFYQKLEKFAELKPVLHEFDQIFRDNTGLSPRSDIRNIGGVGLPIEEGKVMFLGYVDGKFNPAKIVAEIEAAAELIPPNARKKIEIRDVSGKQVIVFSDEKKAKSISAFFHGNDLLFIGENLSLEKLIQGKLRFQEDGKLRAKSILSNEMCFWLDTKALRDSLAKSANPVLAPFIGMLGMFNNFDAQINGNDVQMGFNCADADTAANLKTFLEGQLAGYRMFIDSRLKSVKKPGKEANWMPKAFSYLWQTGVALMAKKTIDETRLKLDANMVFLNCSMPPLADSILSPTTLGATGILAAIAIPNFRMARDKARLKACYSNQRVLTGAVEMYNMDNEKMLLGLNEEIIKILADEKYVRSAPKCPDGGRYISEGDLSSSGKIKCSKHGSFE